MNLRRGPDVDTGDTAGRPSLPPGLRRQLETARYQGLPTFGQRPFLTEPHELDAWSPDVAVVGAPWDGSSFHRPGARFGPRWLRAAAYTPGTYHLELEVEIFDEITVVDYGDALCSHGLVEPSHAAIAERVFAVAGRGIVPVIIGGDHSITWPAATAVADAVGRGRLGIIHFDAHADTAESVDGNLASHGTPMRRLIESGAVPGPNFVQIGLRGYWPPADVFRWMRDRGMTWYLMSDVEERGIRTVVREAMERLLAYCDRIYISVDIDVLDPGFAPGTGTPEPGGMSPRQLLTAVRQIALSAPTAALDVVEVIPAYDHADVTVNNAIRVIYEFLAGLAARRRQEGGRA
jgi:agmatinase